MRVLRQWRRRLTRKRRRFFRRVWLRFRLALNYCEVRSLLRLGRLQGRREVLSRFPPGWNTLPRETLPCIPHPQGLFAAPRIIRREAPQAEQETEECLPLLLDPRQVALWRQSARVVARQFYEETETQPLPVSAIQRVHQLRLAQAQREAARRRKKPEPQRS